MTKDISSFLHRPLHLEPDNLTDHMWGGDWIRAFKGLPPSASPVGESWEFSARPERPTFARFPDGERMSVADLVRDYPREILGSRLAARYGANAPLLVKLIDARDDLSVQVHPNDDQAREMENDFGKSESWLILGASDGAADGFIYIGFNPDKACGYASADAFETAFFDALNQANAQGPSEDRAVREKAERLILPFLNKIRVHAGDVYELRPGTVHAIGRGVRLFEIQQSSDVTYRVWDWNRPDAKKLKLGKKEFRELHMEKARRVLDFRAAPIEDFMPAPLPVPSQSAQVSEHSLIVDRDKKFAANRILFEKEGASVDIETRDDFQILTVVAGVAHIGGEVKQGCSVLLPACAGRATLSALKPSTTIIRSYVPI